MRVIFRVDIFCLLPGEYMDKYKNNNYVYRITVNEVGSLTSASPLKRREQ